MADEIYAGFLERQYEQARAFNAECDSVSIMPGHGQPPCVYQVHYDFRCLVRSARGEIQPHEGFGVRIVFPQDYLRHAEPFRVIQWLYPRNVFACNILGQAHAICVGRLEPGEELIDLIYQAFEIGTGKKMTTNEFDALNRDACQFARGNPHRFPVDDRPLKRMSSGFQIAVSGARATA